VKNLLVAFDLILWEWYATKSYKSGMWYLLWASVFGWKVTKTRDAIRITVKVQSNSKVESSKHPKVAEPKMDEICNRASVNLVNL
jgi:thymidine phosphorylase